MERDRQRDRPARHVVISADGHVFGPGNGIVDPGPLEVLTDYFEPRYRAAYLEYSQRVRAEGAARAARVIGGLFDDEAAAAFAADTGPGAPGLYDSARRLRDLEGEGIVAEVLFPNGVPFGRGFGGALAPQELREAGGRAYNRWLADFCALAPGRRAGMAWVDLTDIDRAVADAQTARANGLKGVLLPNYWAADDLPPYLDRRYDPFWAACEDLAMPVNLHGGASIGDIDMATYGMPAMLTYATETTFLSTRPFTQLVWGGVFERHPTLTFVITESKADWVPSRLAFLDAVYRDQLFRHVKATVKHKPSEYWHRQCFVAASFMSRDEALLRHEIGLDRLMWGADYPHFEGTWPHTDRWLDATFGGLPATEVAAILAHNPARVFGFDLRELAPLAATIGPPIGALEQHEPDGVMWRW
jgi:predicted TIM-barrel fold metal-dependent hydrolase